MFREINECSFQPKHRIDIWGSCVSRDTIEFMPSFTVGAYVARQSAIVTLAPGMGLPVPLSSLQSDFQRRMLTGDMTSDVGTRIANQDAVCVLVDLVDERRGVWKFPNDTYITNSVEAFRTGIDEWGPAAGARLIRFGTDEHFALWKKGFTLVVRRIRGTGKPILLLDIAWAEVFEGQTPPPRGLASVLNSATRRTRRTLAYFVRTAKRKQSIAAGVAGLAAVPPSPGDEYVKIARDANEGYRRYIREAQKLVDVTIHQTPEAVRMKKSHKWGVGPYHYADHVYEKIRDDLYRILGQVL